MDSLRAGLRFGRRASDDTFRAFHEACDADDLQTADELLIIIEDRRGVTPAHGDTPADSSQALLKAQARLWSLRCRRFGDPETASVPPERAPAIHPPNTSRLRDWAAAWLRGPVTRGAMEAGSRNGKRAFALLFLVNPET